MFIEYKITKHNPIPVERNNAEKIILQHENTRTNLSLNFFNGVYPNAMRIKVINIKTILAPLYVKKYKNIVINVSALILLAKREISNNKCGLSGQNEDKSVS